MERVMPALLASDPGAWNIIGWMLLVIVVGAAVLWVVSILLLRSGRHVSDSAGPEPPAS
jgi:hypothetical protein